METTRTDINPARVERRWSVLTVLAVAVLMMMAVPLASRALGGEASYPACGIAPWTGTCTCMMAEDSVAMTYEDFARSLRQAARVNAAVDPDAVLASARRACRLESRSASR